LKPIVVKDQVKLGPGRAFTLSLSGMYYRITRSAITVLILALAVAFLSYVLFYGIIAHDTKYLAYDQLKDSRMLGEWVSRLSTADPQQVIYTNVLHGDERRLAEYRSWGRLTEQETHTLKHACARLAQFYSYFDNIPRSARAVLIADGDPKALARQLVDTKRFETFENLLKELKLAQPMGNREELRAVIGTDYALVQDFASRIQLGQRLAIARIESALAGSSLYDAFGGATQGFKELLHQSGFEVSDAALERLSGQARIDSDMKRLAAFLEEPNLRSHAARRMAIKQSDVNLVRAMEWLTRKRRAEHLAAILHSEAGEQTLDAVRLLTLAKGYARNVALQKAVGDEVPFRRTGIFSLPPRTLWLILVSFLVCVVGISNTMLMSVTDRFTEIATMKCLGAMDGFIMVLFVFEAMMQGVAGSVVGVVLGIVLSLVRSGMGFGVLAFEALPYGDIALIGMLSFVTGIVIAALAATWPSWAAARLAPMEAMRVE